MLLFGLHSTGAIRIDTPILLGNGTVTPYNIGNIIVHTSTDYNVVSGISNFYLRTVVTHSLNESNLTAVCKVTNVEQVSSGAVITMEISVMDVCNIPLDILKAVASTMTSNVRIYEFYNLYCVRDYVSEYRNTDLLFVNGSFTTDTTGIPNERNAYSAVILNNNGR